MRRLQVNEATLSLVGGNIKISADGQQIMNVVDPNPLAYGGVGIHAIWESEARFDNIRVIPEPSAGVLLGVILFGLVVRVRTAK